MTFLSLYASLLISEEGLKQCTLCASLSIQVQFKILFLIWTLENDVFDLSTSGVHIEDMENKICSRSVHQNDLNDMGKGMRLTIM